MHPRDIASRGTRSVSLRGDCTTSSVSPEVMHSRVEALEVIQRNTSNSMNSTWYSAPSFLDGAARGASRRILGSAGVGPLSLMVVFLICDLVFIRPFS